MYLNRSQAKRIVASFLLLVFVNTLLPYQLLASNNGPTAPEAAGFEPVDATDMVNLATGDFSYVLPLLSVPSPEGGYPIALSYHGGVGYSQEASWLGLGWNINPGAINRNVVGYADDWKNVLVRDRVYLFEEVETITLGVGIGIPNTLEADVGIGLSWGSHRSLSGHVSAGMMIGISLPGSDNTKAGVGFDVTYGFSGSPYEGLEVGGFAGLMSSGFTAGITGNSNSGIGISASSFGQESGLGGFAQYNFSQNSFTAAAGHKNFATGMSASSDGSAIIASGNAQMGKGSASAGGIVGAFGDTEVSGFSLSVPLGVIFSLKFGYQKQEYEVDDEYPNRVFGPLYFSDPSVSSGVSPFGNIGNVGNAQLETRFMDVYDVPLPYATDNEFAVFRDDVQKQESSFQFPGYDSYSVSAQGIGGSLKPRFFHNANLIAKGLKKEIDPNTWLHVYSNFGTDFNFSKVLKQTIGNDNGLYFYFDNGFASSLDISHRVKSSNKGSSVNTVDDYFLANGIETFTEYTGRAHTGNFVQVYTNQQLSNGISGFLNPKDYDRSLDSGYTDEGIGGYSITTPDGKTYYYSLPVYHFEEVSRHLLPHQNNTFDQGHYKERISTTPFATHWLLTAVTGPDYIKNASDSVRDYPDEGDSGYWARFDYGKWTDGYTWRNPHNEDVYYNASYDDNKESREMAYGRKQLTYLNRITTRTHTALFVKSVREDATSAAIGNLPNAPGDSYILNYNDEFSLKLDEIILITNKNLDKYLAYEGSNEIPTLLEGANNEPGRGGSLTNQAGNNVNLSWSFKNSENPSSPIVVNASYTVSNDLEVLDENDFETNAEGEFKIYDDAVKVIRFSSDYSLAGNGNYSSGYDSTDEWGTPNTLSTNANEGRLTLQKVAFLGKKAQRFMPDFSFQYENPNAPYEQITDASKENIVKDNWGFRKSDPESWTLNKINTPTGATIEIEHEKDDYYTEAFSRRYWQEGIQVKFTFENNKKYIYFRSDPAYPDFNFLDYFDEDTQVAMDAQYFRNPTNASCNYRIADYAGNFEIESLSSTQLKLRLPQYDNSNTYRQDETCSSFPWSYSQQYNENDGSNGTCSKLVDFFVNWVSPYNQACGFRGNGKNGLKCTLVANRVPSDETGGGIRVKSIKVKDENQNAYTTEYAYNDIYNTNRSSGITSFSPVRGTKFVPYQSELPSPQVLYEYVTMKSVGANGESKGKTVYHFNVLEPHLNIFDPDIKIKNIFEAEVSEDYSFDTANKTENTKIDIRVNSSALGSLLETSFYNKEDQLMNRSRSLYYNFSKLKEMNHKVISESFHNLKSVYKGSETNPVLQKRLLTESRRYEYPSIVLGTEVTQNGFTTFNYKGDKDYVGTDIFDPKTGQTLFTTSHLSDGTKIRTRVFPAYEKYSQMGSKNDNLSNKHMLTQSAQNVVEILTPGSSNWKTMSSSITTWNNNWSIRDFQGQEISDVGIWRKHRSFVWKGDIDETDGAYVGYTNNFNWSNPLSSSSEWQLINEVTRYDDFSASLEVKDINNNFSSTKFDPNKEYVIAGGSAKYTEIYSSGMEYEVSLPTGDFSEGEVQFEGQRVSVTPSCYDENCQLIQNCERWKVHTGNHSLFVNSNDKGFIIEGSVGADRLTTEDFRPGKYKLSVWRYHDQTNTAQAGSTEVWLDINQQRQYSDTVIPAGNWAQYIFYVDLDNYINQDIEINVGASGAYLDDIRMHPNYTSIASYVYDQDSGELTYILGGNNMASQFSYDMAGRLVASYQEVADHQEGIGGFKLISEQVQNYGGVTRVINANGCIEYYENELLNSSFSLTQSNDNTFVVDLDASSSTGNTDSYIWDFGDGNTQTTSSHTITHQYSSAGTYDITLTVSDVNGNLSSSTQTVEFQLNNSAGGDLRVIYEHDFSLVVENQTVDASGYPVAEFQLWNFATNEYLEFDQISVTGSPNVTIASEPQPGHVLNPNEFHPFVIQYSGSGGETSFVQIDYSGTNVFTFYIQW